MTDPGGRPPYGAPYPQDEPHDVSDPHGQPVRPPQVYGSPAAAQPPAYGPPATPQSSVYGSPPPGYGPPTNDPPVYGSPVYGSPAGAPPVYGSPASAPPVYGTPSGSQPGVYGSPAGSQSPVYGSPTGSQSPVYGSPTNDPPVYGSPTSAPPSGYGPPAGPQSPTYGSVPHAPVYGSPASDPYGTPSTPTAYGSPPIANPYDAPQPYGTQLQPYAAAPVQPYDPQQYGAPAGLSFVAVHPNYRLVSPGGRFGGLLLDGLLFMVTLGIGWMIWTLVVWSNGQTPAKQLLHHVVADVNTGQPFGWGQMFVREFLVRGLLFYVISTVTLGIFGLIDACMVWSQDNRTLHDRMSGSVVRHQ